MTTATLTEPRKRAIHDHDCECPFHRPQSSGAKATVVVGMQWGDEGKGKVVDLMTNGGLCHIVARYQGGPNAGHTVVVDEEELILHTVPSGILHKNITNVIGNGVVTDLEGLCKEMDELRHRKVSLKKLKISNSAHVIFPYHRFLEQVMSTSKKLDTTKRGIGPCYMDKIAREGVPIWYFDTPTLAQRAIEEKVAAYNALARQYNANVRARNKKHGETTPTVPIFHAKKVYSEAKSRIRKLQPYITDTDRLIKKALKDGKGVLAEGAQGTELDIDHGTYPYTTSSNTTAGGACTGLGIGPTDIGKVVGILKAYTTRVGEGPMPTEKTDIYGRYLRGVGKEFGATTGRKRRCGWLDLVIARHAVDVNGITNIVVTKLDVLDELEEIPVCIAYEKDGERTKYKPKDLDGWKPIYKILKGWEKRTNRCKTFEELPKEAQNYIKFVEKELDTPINIISVGNDRKQTIYRGAA